MDRNTLVNIGEQRYDRLIEQDKFYIDKTSFIKEWWETGSTVTLITRPRRFGKTLNMSMLECFFSNRYAGRSDLFEGLSIWSEAKYRELQGTFPVIFMSFANVKAVRYADMEYKITKVIADLYEQNRYLLKSNLLSGNEREYYDSIKPGMDAIVASDAVHSMANFMRRFYEKDVIIILDEYDTPMQEAWLNGYWDEAVDFLRDFFNSTFKIDEQIVFNQLEEDENAVWSLLMATGYLKVVKTEPEECEDAFGAADNVWYTLALTNYEVRQMFRRMVKRWFSGSARMSYNNFIRALLINDVDAMNDYMNKIALHSFSSFDMAQGVSDDDAPERFYHGFVLGLMVELSGQYEITSNRESGFGRYDVMLKPMDREKDCAYIIEFKVYKSYKEKTLMDTLANAHAQIEEKQYEAGLIAEGFVPGQIRKYGFAFQGKKCLIG